jgi:hypothetical protein
VNFVFLQETVSFRAIIHEDGLKTAFNPGNDTFVNIALGDFLETALRAKLFELVVLEFGNPTFFRIDGIDQDLDTHLVLSLRWCGTAAIIPDEFLFGMACGCFCRQKLSLGLNMKLCKTSQSISDRRIGRCREKNYLISARYSMDLSFISFYGIYAARKKPLF